MESKRILVTGGSRGIGRALVQALAEAEMIVGLNYVQSDEAASQIARQYPNVSLLKADVRDHEAISAAVKTFAQENGGLDIVVNNAGVGNTRLLIRKRPADVRAEIETNLLGVISVTQAALPFMLKQKNGLIVGISSIAAIMPQPGAVTYAASKAGLEAFLKGIALEYLSRGIRTIGIRLGPVQTELLGQLSEQQLDSIAKRLVSRAIPTPEQVAPVLLNAIFEQSQLQTGCVLTYDGGYSLRAI